MTTHRILVTVEAAKIVAEPDTLVMTQLDEVHWTGTTPRRFSIVFDGAGPFGARQLGHDVANAAQRPRAKGRFKYTIVSESDPAVQLDPVIIIDEPPSGPNP